MASLSNITTNYTNKSSIQQKGALYVACDILDISLAGKIAEILVFFLILLSSLVGNTLIIIIVFKCPALRNTVNYFIVNMSVSDFMFPLVSIPVRIAEIMTSSLQWQIRDTVGLIFCKLYVFMERVSLFVSIQSLVWIALDRFLAVVFPMKAHLISSRFRVFAITSTWIVAMIVRSLDLYALDLVHITDGVICTHNAKTDVLLDRDYERVNAAIFILAPFIIMTILYGVIAATLRRQGKTFRCSEVHQRTRRKRSAVRMSFCIMAACYICLLPLILNFILAECKIALPSCLSYKIYWILGYLMFSLSSSMNPIICLAFVGSYRRGLWEVISSCWSKRLTTNNPRTDRNTDEITLQDIRVVPEARDNRAFCEG